MQGKSKWTVLFVVAAVAAATLYYLYGYWVKTDGDPWQMVPKEAAVILEVDHPGVFHEKLLHNTAWQSLNNTLLFKRVELRLRQLDTLLADKPAYLGKMRSHKLLIAFESDTGGRVRTLFLSALRVNPSGEKIKHYLSERLGPDYAVIPREAGQYTLFKVVDAVHDLRYYFSITDGVLLFSMEEEPVEKAVNRYENRSVLNKNTDDFTGVRNFAGKKADARVYLNYKTLPALLSLAADKKYGESLAFLSSFARWTETDVILKKRELIFSGYTTAKEKGLFLNRFTSPAPAEGLFNIVPFDANLLLSLKNYRVPSAAVNKMDKKYKVQTGLLVKAVESGITLFGNPTSVKEYSSKIYLAVDNGQEGALEKALKQLSVLSGTVKTTRYKKYVIRKIGIKKLWAALLGEAFSGITGNYYTFLEHRAVFANSIESLKYLIDYYDTGKTLDLNENFKEINDNIQSETNLLLMISPRLFSGLLDKYLNKNTARGIKNNMGTVEVFQNALFQFTAGKPLAYTNFYIRFGKSFHEENLALWKVVLKDEAAGKPYLVKNHLNGLNDVIVFDKSHNMYLINANGRILWSKKLVQNPISDIEQVDYYKNGKIQFLFNTEDNLYLIDRKGRFTANYPIRLHPSATNGLTLFDYNKRKDYRILIAQADKRVYNYTIKGKQVRGWSKPKLQNIAVDKIQRLVANHRDYIIITDVDNRVYVVNRRGNTRINVQRNFKKARNSLFYVNRTNGKGIILTTDQKGRLAYLSSTGFVRYTTFGNFSPEHYFLYEDFNNDGWKDFIFIDNRKLLVFDKFKKILFQYTFSSNITTQPQFFKLGNGKKVLGVVASEEKTVYLFDQKGNTLVSKGLVGETPFTVGSLNNDKTVNLITAAGNVLYNYRIK